MITIEICHANDVVRDGWKVVEHIASITEVEEHLTSPNFEWSEGTCVRVMSSKGDSVYAGIYNADTLVDVGPESDVTERFPWVYNNSASDFLRAFGWIGAWLYCAQPTWMLEGVALIVDKKIILRCAAEIMVFTIDEVDDARKYIRNVVDAVHDYSTGNLDSKNLKETIAVLPERSSLDDHLLKAVKLLVEAKHPWPVAEMAHHVLMIFANQDTEVEFNEAKNRISDIVRKYIPFYDIAKAITK